MTLAEFCELVRNNIDFFESDYLEKRDDHPNPDDAYPLTQTPEMWFQQMDIWFTILEATKNANVTEIDSGTVEFEIDNYEEEDEFWKIT